MEFLETSLYAGVHFLELLCAVISVACVATGLVATTTAAIAMLLRADHSINFNALRLRLATWLTLALEFQLAADIVTTTTAPSVESLAQLGAIAAIRTFLNYFLQKEIEAERRFKSAPQQVD